MGQADLFSFFTLKRNLEDAFPFLGVLIRPCSPLQNRKIRVEMALERCPVIIELSISLLIYSCYTNAKVQCSVMPPCNYIPLQEWDFSLLCAVFDPLNTSSCSSAR